MNNFEKSVSESQLYREYLQFCSYHVNPPTYREWKKYTALGEKDIPTSVLDKIPFWNGVKND